LLPVRLALTIPFGYLPYIKLGDCQGFAIKLYICYCSFSSQSPGKSLVAGVAEFEDILMPQQQSLTAPSPTGKEKMNLLALVFFLLGALHIYQKLQMGKYWLGAAADFAWEQCMKVSLWAVVLAGIAQIWSLKPGF
jgi:hypothetical protein